MTTSRKTQPDPKTRVDQSKKPVASPARRWMWFGVRCVLYYCGVVLMLAFFQRTLMYPATRVQELKTLDAGLGMGQVHDVSIQSKDGLTLHGWQILPKGKSAVNQASCDALLQQGGPVVIFFCGNGGNRRHRREEYQELARLNCHIFVFDYRGYGENPGSPSEKRIREDALEAWRFVTEDRKVEASRIVLYGESLGGGVATHLAADVCDALSPPAGLILRSTFSSMLDAACYNYPWLPVRLVLIDRYLSIQRIPHVTCPILMLHGSQDTIVPLELGKRLFEAAPDQSASGVAKTFVELPRANHNDVLLIEDELFRKSVAEFLQMVK